MIFQGIRTSIAKKPYIFVIFQRGDLDPLSLALNPPMLLPYSTLAGVRKTKIDQLNELVGDMMDQGSQPRYSCTVDFRLQ